MHTAKWFALSAAAVVGLGLFAATSAAAGVNPAAGQSSAAQLTASITLNCPKNSNGTYCWMSPDIGAAWAGGYFGQRVSITFVDDFSGSSPFSGNFGLGTQTQGHGFWTTEEAGLVAPGATIFRDDFSTEVPVTLHSGLNVINASYGFVGLAFQYSSRIWSQYPQEQSMIAAAKGGTAVVSKAAGNDAVAVGSSVNGKLDYLDVGLIGAQSAIFVGALNHNGTTSNKASLAYYSDYAGSNLTVQSHFLVVGVEGDKTALYGTSFAAPVISGYAAILGSKFTTATPTQITNRLLDTARTDTLVNYSAARYGKGEASLGNALAPDSIH